jgi:hypothetical protein
MRTMKRSWSGVVVPITTPKEMRMVAEQSWRQNIGTRFGMVQKRPVAMHARTGFCHSHVAALTLAVQYKYLVLYSSIKEIVAPVYHFEVC